MVHTCTFCWDTCRLTTCNTDHAVAVGVDLVRDATTGEVLGRHVDGRADDDTRRRPRPVVVRRNSSRYAIVADFGCQSLVQQDVGTTYVQNRHTVHTSYLY